MVGKIIRFLIVLPFLLFAGCSTDMESQSVDLLSAFDFDSGNQDWIGGISDYPVHDSTDYFLSNLQVPSSYPLEGKGLNITADNPHGDLFYYFKRRIQGLVPNKKYNLDFEFLVYTQLITQSENLSSEELYLKMGAVNYEPTLEQAIWRNSMDYLTLNVDKGQSNSDSGTDIINVGSVKEFTGELPDVISGNSFGFDIEVESDSNGEVWLVIGIDSGIKSQLSFGLAALTIYYTEQN